MPRKQPPPTPEQVKDAADRAEGIKPMPASVGRPTTYSETYVVQAEKLSKLGHTEAEMADFFEVASSTFTLWKTKYPEFSAALKIGKAEPDTRVERSLYNRAVGYTFDSEKVFCSKDGEITRAPIRVHVAPDVTACIFWLKNRKSMVWRDVHRHEIGEPGEFERLNDMELIDRLRQEALKLGIAPPPLAISKTEH